MLRQCRPPVVRTLRQFAEQEIVVPTGPYAGQQFRCDTQPFAGLLFDELDHGGWSDASIIGPTQSGKTLCGHCIPALYLLFERGETIIIGIPDMNMAQDKWREDLSPVLERTRYDQQRPTRGEGSRGGAVKNAIKFNRGTLKYMSGGGQDAKRSAFTARAVLITEVDKLDVRGGTSRETDKVSQLRARSDAFGDTALTIMESTASYENGRIWREYQNGSSSRIACPCPHCAEYVTPEREHLTGWQEAESEQEARTNAAWGCPACGVVISEAERVEMNLRAVLLHKGQAAVAGKVTGKKPTTRTLGFRWNAFNNLFWTAATIAAREWNAAQDPDEENAKREMLQFVWAMPYKPPSLDLTALDFTAVAKRTVPVKRGYVPNGTELITSALDLGLRLCDWVVLAHSHDGTPHVVDYGVIEVHARDLGLEAALLAVMREYREMCETGWPDQRGGDTWQPAEAWIDSGWGDSTDTVYQFVRDEADESPVEFRACKGHGASQVGRAYSRPRATGSVVVHIGNGYHLSQLQESGVLLAEYDADAWKSYTHQRIKTPLGQTGALTLFEANPKEHYSFTKQLTAETQIEEFVPGKGTVVRWENKRRRPNHKLDCACMASAAARLAGVRLGEQSSVAENATDDTPTRRGISRPDGRGYLEL